MSTRIDEERKRILARYMKSKRHIMEVDFDNYLRDLKHEFRRG